MAAAEINLHQRILQHPYSNFSKRDICRESFWR